MVQANGNPDAEPETEQQVKESKEWQTVEDTMNSNHSTVSDTLKEPDVVDIVGDIIQVHHNLSLPVAKGPISSPAHSNKNR